MENNRYRYKKIAAHMRAITIIFLLLILSSVSLAQEEFEFEFHDDAPWGGVWLFPIYDEAAGFFMFPIEWEPWMESIEFTKLRFFHTEESSRPFRVLMILRDFEDEEYEIVDDTSIRETTCSNCWEEVDLYFQETSFLASFNRCYGMFVNILPDDTQPMEPFIIWSDQTVDHPLSSAKFSSLSEDPYGYLDTPQYNSDGGNGEFLLEVEALIWGITPTGETTFTKIKLMYGNH
jgi:hypothetical protein